MSLKRDLLRKIGRICGWLAAGFLLLALLTGYGITEFRIITPLTFGLLNKAAAQRLHPYVEAPMAIFLVIHLGIGIWSRREYRRTKKG
jgi:cytochrome b subunit of formate dehydrogenase